MKKVTKKQLSLIVKERLGSDIFQNILFFVLGQSDNYITRLRLEHYSKDIRRKKLLKRKLEGDLVYVTGNKWNTKKYKYVVQNTKQDILFLQMLGIIELEKDLDCFKINKEFSFAELDKK